jgi:hypothetical protein
MRRYFIPFAVGLMLGIGTVPAWTTTHPAGGAPPLHSTVSQVKI